MDSVDSVAGHFQYQHSADFEGNGSHLQIVELGANGQETADWARLDAVVRHCHPIPFLSLVGCMGIGLVRHQHWLPNVDIGPVNHPGFGRDDLGQEHSRLEDFVARLSLLDWTFVPKDDQAQFSCAASSPSRGHHGSLAQTKSVAENRRRLECP